VVDALLVAFEASDFALEACCDETLASELKSEVKSSFDVLAAELASETIVET
jgi:hypothetical protein